MSDEQRWLVGDVDVESGKERKAVKTVLEKMLNFSLNSKVKKSGNIQSWAPPMRV